MHTLLVLGAGFALLAVCALVARLSGGVAALPGAMLAFLPLWLLGAGYNLYVGVTQAGYSVEAEAPIFLVVFGVPALVALGLRAWLRRRAAGA